jgi:cytochrome c oxidase subunit 3
MSDGATRHHEHAHSHEHEWETSPAPLAIVAGVVLLVPITFSSYFVYEKIGQTAVVAALGAIILIYGIARWVSEALAHKNMVEGAAAMAFPMFIGSEAFMFLAMFAAYWMLRLTADIWPPVDSPEMHGGMAVAMLGLMVLSSLTVSLAGRRHQNGDLSGFCGMLALTIILGGAFLGCTWYEYSGLMAQGFFPRTNAFGAAYYTITSFHALHVLLGIGTFLFMLIPALSGKTDKTFILCASVFWYFLTVTSLFAVTQLYFW